MRVVCDNHQCGASVQRRCGCSAASRCLPCSDTNRRRFARVIETGLADAPGFAYFVTLTAPGAPDPDHRQWVQGKQKGQRRPPCSCWDHGLTLGAWNRQESASWNRLRTALARTYGSLAFVSAVEAQTLTRYALHRHLVIRSGVPLDARVVQVLALEAGYGCVLDVQEIGSAAAMGRYLSKYVTKGGDRDQVPWEDVYLNEHTGELITRTTPTYRLRSQSLSWGITMKQIRAAAADQARNRAMYLRELDALLVDDAGSTVPAAPAGADPP